MQAELQSVRARFAQLILPSVRVEVDVGVLPDFVSIDRYKRISRLRATALRCNSDVTPRLSQVADRVCLNLGISRTLFDLFVYPDSTINGFCVLGSIPLSIGVSSHAVNALDDSELAFVIGHEIGHGIFEHAAENISDDSSYENALLSRSLELTMDRVGILATKDSDASMRAMLKTMSGLDSTQLRFDLSSFAHEARQVQSALVEMQDPLSSHPPFVIRYRAALAFLASDAYAKLSGGNDDVIDDDIAQANKFITDALEKSADRQAMQIIREVVSEMVTWFAVFFVRNQMQISLATLSSISGVTLTRQDVERAVEFVASYAPDESDVVLGEKLNLSITKALQTAPRRVNRFVEALRDMYPRVSIMPLDLYDKFSFKTHSRS